MLKRFDKGAIKLHKYLVKKADIAAFESGVVHDVCSTFALAREIEWSTRLFVLEMLEEEEQGIGTKLEIKHLSPAFVGEELILEARFNEITQSEEIICYVSVFVKDRKIAEALTGQRILPQEKLNNIFNKIKTHND